MPRPKTIINYIFLFVLVILAGCGGGGPSTPTNGAATTNVDISGTVTPPPGVSASSLTIVSLGQTSTIKPDGSFSTEVYQDGVAVVSAMVEGKEFGLLNVAASLPSTNSAGLKVLSAKSSKSAKAASASVELTPFTTAVSMVFMTPYFLTTNPQTAANLLGIIENDPKVAIFAAVIEKVFNEADPLNNAEFQSAFKDAVTSVWATATATASAEPAPVQASTKVINLQKNAAKSLYSQKHKIDFSQLILNVNNYNLTIDSKETEQDWLAEVMELDPSQFSSQSDLVAKAENNRWVYEGEMVRPLGQLTHEANGKFKNFDLIRRALDYASEQLFGTTPKDSIEISPTKDAVYLVRGYSGAWGTIMDAGEKDFVQSAVPNGANFDREAFSRNFSALVFDVLGIMIPAADNDEVREWLKSVMNNAVIFAKTLPPSPTKKDIVKAFAELLKNDLKELAVIQSKEVSAKNAADFFGNVFQLSADLVLFADAVGKVGDLGQVIGKIETMLFLTTPLESALVVVGDPFPIDVPTNVNATHGTYLGDVKISWTGVKGSTDYFIYYSETSPVTKTDYTYKTKITFGSELNNEQIVSGLAKGGLTIGKTYYFVVTAARYDMNGNKKESDESSTISYEITLPPPTNVYVTNGLNPGEVKVSWAGVKDTKDYSIYYSETSPVTKTNYSYKKTIADGNEFGNESTITGLEAGKIHYFVVTATRYDANGNKKESAESNEAVNQLDCTIFEQLVVGKWKVTLTDGSMPEPYDLELFAGGKGVYGNWPVSWKIARWDTKLPSYYSTTSSPLRPLGVEPGCILFETGFWHPAFKGLVRSNLQIPVTGFSIYRLGGPFGFPSDGNYFGHDLSTEKPAITYTKQ